MPTTTYPEAGHKPGQIFARLCLLILCSLSLAACKLVIIVPAGGKVVSANGEECLANSRCVIEVNGTDFDDRFTAAPDDDYLFLHWKKRSRGLCALSRATCRLYSSFVVGNPDLEAILASDTEFFLEPVFVKRERLNKTYWAALLDEIDEGRFTLNNFLYQVRPNLDQCDPGVLTIDAKLRFLQTLNLVRALHDLPPVDYDNFFDMQVQQASLIQEANSYLNHFPKPQDLCYSADGDTGSGTSNLSGGGLQGDPAAYLLGWTNDNRNIASLMAAGHRRWVLFPGLGFTAYGQVGSSAAMKAFGFNQAPRLMVPASVEFVAFPHRNYPYILVEKGPKPTPWSISMVPPMGMSSQFDYFSQATVTVTEDSSGKSLAVHSQYSDTDGFGLSNFFSWMVDGWEYDRSYTVTVSDIRMPGGDVRTIEYPVRLDRFNLINIQKKLEKGDGRSGDVLSGTFKNDNDKDSYTVALSGSRTFSLSNGQFAGGFFVLVYDANKKLVTSSSESFSRNFPAGNYTVMVSPCDNDGLCFIGAENYSVTIQ